MDIDLPLILVLLSLAGIIIWLFDFFVLRSRRNARIIQLRNEYPDWDNATSPQHKRYQKALDEQVKEHIVVRETKAFLPIILLVLVVRSFIIEPFQIPSSSMEPTLQVNDFILVNKYTYGIRLPVIRTEVLENNTPARGDVMVFFPPHDDRYFIKRVIGLPGDTVEYRNKVLYINGEEQKLTPVEQSSMDYAQRNLYHEQLGDTEHFIFRNPRAVSPDFKTVVKSGHYFMMGDNRDNSSDSRRWGQVPEERIVGKAFAIWMHWEDWSLPSFSRVGKIH